MTPAWRARKRCRVSEAIPDSCPSVFAAEAEGARPHDPVAAALRQRPEALQHGGLAGSGVALDADHAILCGEDRLDRGLLALVEPAPVELRLRHPAPHDGLLRALAGAHALDRLGFPCERRVRRPVPAMVEALRRMEPALVFERGDRALRGCHRHRAGFAAERRGEEVAVPEHRLALREVLDRPARGVPGNAVRMREEVGRGAIPFGPVGHSRGWRRRRTRASTPGASRSPAAHPCRRRACARAS